MNIELLNKIMNHIEEEPRRFNMTEWYVDVASEIVALSHGVDEETVLEDANSRVEGSMVYFFEDVNDIPPCGAVGCLAGTACILSGKAIKAGSQVLNGQEVVQYDAPRLGWFEAASEALGLTEYQACRLFYPRKGFGRYNQEVDSSGAGLYWPEPFASEYRNNENDPIARVRVVKARIAHFIATEGRE